MTDVLLFAAVGAGHLVGVLAPEIGVLGEWLDERRIDRLAR